MATLRSYGAKVGNRGAARGPTISDHLGVGLFATGWGVGSKTVVGIFGGCGLRIDVFFSFGVFFFKLSISMYSRVFSRIHGAI